MKLERYYVVTSPGMEELAVRELEEKAPGLAVVSSDRGGFEIEAPMEMGRILVSLLKIPTRILWRLHEGRYRDFPKMFKSVGRLPWPEWLRGTEDPAHSPLKFSLHVTAKKSRLNNEKRIAETLVDAIEGTGDYRFHKGSKEELVGPIIHARNFNDNLTLSLDVSSGAMYKRGYKVMEGAAPLRENLAAAIFYFVTEKLGAFDTLIDPLCGTGTLLLEAQSFYWSGTDHTVAEMQGSIDNFYAFDRHAEPLQTLQMNLKSLEKTFGRKAGQWVIASRDVLSADPVDIVGQKKVVISNPPYGKRIRLPEPPQKFYRSLIESCEKFEPHAIGFIFPNRLARHVPTRTPRFSRKSDLRFSTGGLPVTFRLFY